VVSTGSTTQTRGSTSEIEVVSTGSTRQTRGLARLNRRDSTGEIDVGLDP